MHNPQSISAQDALQRLKNGNAAYLRAVRSSGDITPERRRETSENGQHPYAVIVTCSDSRVVPEHIFMTGLGELFCCRCAGNVVGSMGLASVLYAAEHLGTKLVLVLGHTHCGAVEAGMELADSPDGAPDLANAIRPLVERVMAAIGDERDPYRAAVLNAQAAAAAKREIQQGAYRRAHQVSDRQRRHGIHSFRGGFGADLIDDI